MHAETKVEPGTRLTIYIPYTTKAHLYAKEGEGTDGTLYTVDGVVVVVPDQCPAGREFRVHQSIGQ